jgi:hypothetical protein
MLAVFALGWGGCGCTGLDDLRICVGVASGVCKGHTRIREMPSRLLDGTEIVSERVHDSRFIVGEMLRSYCFVVGDLVGCYASLWVFVEF